MSCAFCGMPPRDGQGCCTPAFRVDTMRRADRRIEMLEANVVRLREALDDAIRTWAFHDWQGHAHSWHDREDWFERHEVARERRVALRDGEAKP